MNQNAPEPLAAAETLAEVPEHVLRGLPEEVRLFPSAVDKTRIGVWATKPILKGKKFGPFVGDKKKRSQVKNNVYMWEVYYPNLGWMCIDATDPEKGNWLRYVNWACSGEEQNLFPLEINRAIYYKTLKPIAPGEELLVWYNGEDNPEIAAAIEEERASARSKRSSPKSRKGRTCRPALARPASSSRLAAAGQVAGWIAGWARRPRCLGDLFRTRPGQPAITAAPLLNHGGCRSGCLLTCA
ncbi:PR domain zinc finger protein 2-like [Callospermophilus lateralis]|uniref:PR domain zinc finger protein 2-like n=1 Tax=Callospermophilus lateralis TaxID=76772 RepID=UPI004038CC53